MNLTDGSRNKSRGAQSNPHNRFATRHSSADLVARGGDTEARVDHSRTIVSSNDSPDVPFSQSINPYKGCEHGCIYCFARPSHEYLDLSLGEDFETRLFYKPDAVALLKKFLEKPGYRCQPIVLGANTDPYQPLDKEKELSRQILQTLLEYRHPVSIVTKGSLILRDLDILSELASLGLVSVAVSVTTLDNGLKTIMEPRACAPGRRLKVIRELCGHGVPVGFLFAPVIPFINDHELEDVVAACAAEGAASSGYVMLRLPWQLKDLFSEWLALHFPQRRERVLNRLRDLRGGGLYQNGFGRRMSGQGVYAGLIRQRFEVARRRHGLDGENCSALRRDLFRVPGRAEQLGLGL